jgi:hypothetical protein
MASTRKVLEIILSISEKDHCLEPPMILTHGGARIKSIEYVRIHLSRAAKPEIQTKCPADFPAGFDRLFFGGRCDGQSNWEGCLDEIAVLDRTVTPDAFQSR